MTSSPRLPAGILRCDQKRGADTRAPPFSHLIPPDVRVCVCKSAALDLLVMVRNYVNRFESPFPPLSSLYLCLTKFPFRHFATDLFVVLPWDLDF